jgi:hypothetical protein
LPPELEIPEGYPLFTMFHFSNNSPFSPTLTMMGFQHGWWQRTLWVANIIMVWSCIYGMLGSGGRTVNVIKADNSHLLHPNDMKRGGQRRE